MSEIAVIPGELGTGRTRTRRVPWSIAPCLIFIAALVVMAVFGSIIAPHDPYMQNLGLTNAHPSGDHWFGTDLLGRDVFSRVIVGARLALIGPLLIAIGSGVFGSVLGVLAGYRGGTTDSLIMRWVDLMWSVPSLLVLIVVAGAFGGGYWLAVGMLVVLTTPFDTRVLRGATLEQAPRPYVEAAKTLGVPDRKIMLFHIWPNVTPVVVANTFLVFAGSLVGLSGLSFLGLGSRPGTPDWGVMLAESRSLLFGNPVASLAPGAMIILTAVSMNLVGDWLYELLADRGLRR